MKVRPAGRRSSIRHVGDGIVITIPAKCNFFRLVFLGAWLVGWGFGEFMAASMLITAPHDGAKLFIGAWLVAWTVGGGFAVYTWLWMAAGKEIIFAGPEFLAIKRDVMGFGRLKEYDWTHVARLRSSMPIWNPYVWNSGLQFWGVSGGTVAFDYGAKTVRFGASLDDAESTWIVEELNTYRTQESAAPDRDGHVV
jgi:hypothetical protein